jgi:hypothetical protein
MANGIRSTAFTTTKNIWEKTTIRKKQKKSKYVCKVKDKNDNLQKQNSVKKIQLQYQTNYG